MNSLNLLLHPHKPPLTIQLYMPIFLVKHHWDYHRKTLNNQEKEQVLD